MTIARFFDRVYAAAGRQLSISRQDLEVVLLGKSVGIQCGSACEGEGNPRWIAEMLINLLSRFYPRLSIKASAHLTEELLALARAINPAIEIDQDISNAQAVVSVGDTWPGAIYARADGWVASVLSTYVDDPPGPPNPYSAAAAAAIAASEVFRIIFQERLPVPGRAGDLRVSLLDFSEKTGAERHLPKGTIGEVAFVGLGAVANGALWALGRHEGLRGRSWLVDPERLELSNLQRYVLSRDADVGRDKIEMAREALVSTKLEQTFHRVILDEFADSFSSGFTIPTVCVSVDNVQGRRTAQALLPRLVINGWTSDSGLGASWHEFSRDAACLACLYQPRGTGPSQTDLVAQAFGLTPERATALWISQQAPSEAELKNIATYLGAPSEIISSWRGKPLSHLYSEVVCGSVRLDVRGLGRIEAVPLAHQSALAGVLMAVELIKRTDPELCEISQPETLISWDDVLRPPPRRWAQPRPREPRCICSDAIYQEAYTKKWQASQVVEPLLDD